MKALKAIVLLLFCSVVALGLALSCPSEDSFGRWAKEKLGGESDSLVEQVKGTFLSTEAKWTATYEDHMLWATVDAYQGSAHHRYLGVAGTWFELGER